MADLECGAGALQVDIPVGRTLFSTSHQPSLEILVGNAGLAFALIDIVFMTLVWHLEMQKLRSISGNVQAVCADFVQMDEQGICSTRSMQNFLFTRNHLSLF